MLTEVRNWAFAKVRIIFVLPGLHFTIGKNLVSAASREAEQYFSPVVI